MTLQGHYPLKVQCRPDMTFAVDWALNNNYLSIYQGAAQLHKQPLTWIWLGEPPVSKGGKVYNNLL